MSRFVAFPTKVRHKATPDELQTYGWLRHNGRSFGRQQLIDEAYNISVSMVKRADEESGTGGDWAVRVTTTKVPGKGSARKRISVVMVSPNYWAFMFSFSLILLQCNPSI